MAGKEYYGIDAPTVVRNLGLGGPGLIGISVGMRFFHIVPALAPTALATGMAMSVMACWMMASSLWLKQRVRDRLLDMRRWRGDEAVLDVGCGRGLVAMGAARRVPAGSVKGVDLWQDVDLSDNSPAAFLANAEAAGVAGRVSVDTGDARRLPYADASFDAIGSMTAIHNIPDAAGRAAAIAEMWRVLQARRADPDVRYPPCADLSEAAPGARRGGDEAGRTDPAMGADRLAFRGDEARRHLSACFTVPPAALRASGNNDQVLRRAAIVRQERQAEAGDELVGAGVPAIFLAFGGAGGGPGGQRLADRRA